MSKARLTLIIVKGSASLVFVTLGVLSYCIVANTATDDTGPLKFLAGYLCGGFICYLAMRGFKAYRKKVS